MGAGAGLLDEGDAHGIALAVRRLRPCVGEVDHLPGRGHAAKAGVGAGTNERLAPPRFGKGRRRAIERTEPKAVAFGTPEDAELRLADAGRVRQHGVEHRLELAGRARYDAQHVGGRGLLLQRLTQLVEQPHVLDGDDGLAGEAPDQLDLLVGERPHLLAEDADRADQLVVLEHRHDQKGTAAGELHLAHEQRIAVDIGLLLW